jgi:ornithine cyclodeaminase/alanine dehydrogenase-like protein (mu-crystallin family)
MHGQGGGFHVKAGFLDVERPYFAAKINANFPGNAARGLPTIQGAVALFDAADGRLLALMDSMAITALRTAAASAVAARHLARERSETLLLCGCGGQAREQLRALLCVRSPRRVLVHDLDSARAARFAAAAGDELGIEVSVAARLEEALAKADLIVTCTTARHHFIDEGMVAGGTFIAAVGADSEHKQEIDPALLARAKVVTDVTAQAAAIGDLHHAIEAGVMGRDDVHAELGEVVARRKPGRENDEEIAVFDSTGTGLQDVAASIAAYRAALAASLGTRFDFAARNVPEGLPQRA